MDEPSKEEGAGKRQDLAYDIIRPDVVDRAVQSLLEDAERCEGQLPRAEVNRVYFRRNLTVEECGEVEGRLRQHCINIIESEESEEGEDGVEGVAGQINFSAKKYLTPEEEVERGRKIQFENKVLASAEALDSAFKARVTREADDARRDFLETNERYVWKLAGAHLRGAHFKREDLYQEGMIGVLRAAATWDPERGFRFKTYATWWVQQTMRRALANGERTVRLPVHLHESVNRIKRSETRLSAEIGRRPTIEELAAHLGANPHRIAKLMWHVQLTQCVEADAPVSEDSTILSFKVDDADLSGFDYVAQRELREILQRAMMELSPREERVLRMRFGFDGDKEYTLESVGFEFALTRERIRQIEAKALRKLGRADRKRALMPFVVD